MDRYANMAKNLNLLPPVRISKSKRLVDAVFSLEPPERELLVTDKSGVIGCIGYPQIIRAYTYGCGGETKLDDLKLCFAHPVTFNYFSEIEDITSSLLKVGSLGRSLFLTDLHPSEEPVHFLYELTTREALRLVSERFKEQTQKSVI